VLFVAGLTGWATNIALEVDGDVVLGVMTSAALGRRWSARRGRGAWQSRTAAPRETATRLRVSDRAALAGSRSTMIPPLDALQSTRRCSTSSRAPPESGTLERQGADVVAEQPVGAGNAGSAVAALAGPRRLRLGYGVLQLVDRVDANARIAR
jgi:hypothetical protein